MSIKERVLQAQAQGEAQFVVVYANIGNNADELIVCEAADADEAGCAIVDVYFVEHNSHMRTMVITAEVA